MNRYLVAYVPVLHEGYLKLFRTHGGILCLVEPSFVGKEYPRLIRDLRQISVQDAQQAIASLGIMRSVDVLTHEYAEAIDREQAEVTLTQDEISNTLARVYFTHCTVRYETPFLRWDKPITLQETEVRPDQLVSTEKFDRLIMDTAAQEAHKSSDWWRQIGAVAIKNGNILFTEHNKYLPSDDTLFAAGNPRDNFDAGEHPEVYTSIHAEASIVAQAAREGVSLFNTSVYVTTFPCANCARLLAEAGVQKIYYRSGYSRLDALDILKAYDIKVIQVS